jgi:hypothetical protein
VKRWAGAVFILFAGCSSRIYDVAYPTLKDGQYDSEFPYRDCSAQLEEIGRSIKIIYATAYYKTFLFDEASRVRESDLAFAGTYLKAAKVQFTHNSTLGTATVIQSDTRTIMLLTCAHVVDFDDTIRAFYGGAEAFIKSVAIKEKQSNFIRDIPEAEDIEILAADEAMDIAVIGKRFVTPPTEPAAVFRYPMGRSKELKWGSFVYLIGYPMGHKMITKGTVSSPDRDKKGSFLTDAPFNRGFSGGLVLAIRDGVPNFEWVGVARSVAANYEYILTPSKDIDASRLNPGAPYEGEIFVGLKSDIRYGITHVVSTELISAFVKRHAERLEKSGYDVSRMPILD